MYYVLSLARLRELIHLLTLTLTTTKIYPVINLTLILIAWGECAWASLHAEGVWAAP